MGIILDSGFLFSLVSRQDDRHAAAKETFTVVDWNQRAPVVVPSTVIVETITLAMYRTKGHPVVLAHLEELFWGQNMFFRIKPVLVENYKEIVEMMRKLTEPGRFFSFTDASIVFTARKNSINEIVTFDSHFEGLLFNCVAGS